MKMMILGQVLDGSQCSKATRVGAYGNSEEALGNGDTMYHNGRGKLPYITMQNSDVLASASHHRYSN